MMIEKTSVVLLFVHHKSIVQMCRITAQTTKKSVESIPCLNARIYLLNLLSI